MTAEAWAFLGVAVTALAGVVVEMIRSRRREHTVKEAAQQAQASAQAVQTTAAAALAEFSPNGGSSLKDKIDRMADTQQQILEQQGKQWSALRQQGERLARVEGAIDTLRSSR